MNPNDSSVAMGADLDGNERPVFRNTVIGLPDTDTARAHESIMLRHARDRTYSVVGEMAGHDKTWLSRVFKGELKASFFEWIAVMDGLGLRVTAPSAESAADADLLNALLRKTAAVLEREASTAGEGDVFLHADEYKSLLVFAQRGIKSMQEAAL